MHTFGYPVDMDTLFEICEHRNIQIVKMQQKLGSNIKTKGLKFCITTCFSFNGNKIMTTGGGGMIVTNDENLAEELSIFLLPLKRILYFMSTMKWMQYRHVNVLAAIGCAQLEKMEIFKHKKKNWNLYNTLLKDVKGFHSS